MRKRLAPIVALALLLPAAPGASDEPDVPPQNFTFRDVTAETGLLPHVKGIMGHGAGWGDVNGDGWLDLYVATFEQPASEPNRLLLNREGRFERAPEKSVRISTRATGVLFADLDNDGDRDLYVGSMPAPEGSRLAERTGRPLRGCSLFRNDGGGKFTDVSAGNAACPAAFGGRSAAVLDYDGDGRLDLLVGEDPFPGYNGSQTKCFRLFRNLGGLKFEHVNQRVGLPTENTPGLGVAAADVNDDSWPDLFVASTEGGNRLFLNDGQGRFTEAPGSPEVFQYEGTGGDNMVCGVCFGDVNADGHLDLVLGQHFSTPWVEPVENRLYLNRGPRAQDSLFEDVTEQAGLPPLPLKAPHVELQDFDNDGRLDLYASFVKFDANGRPHPLVFRNVAAKGGVPQFETTMLAVNDYPNEEDRAIKRSGPFFQRMVEQGRVTYTAPGPTADFDNDGRLDMFLPSWWTELPSRLLRNETPSGRWLQISIRGREEDGVNRMGIGSRVSLYRAGKAGDPDAFLGTREIAAGFGYASGQPAIAHFGLGEVSEVDVVVRLPHGKGSFTVPGVKADQRIVLSKTAGKVAK